MSLPGSHPLRDARWIWPYLWDAPRNAYAEYRYDFPLGDPPAKAPLFVTADQAYRLYVNGKHVGRGPARGMQECWAFDEYDVAEHLRKGWNWIAAVVHTPGISTFQYVQKASDGGLLLAADWGETRIATGKGWLQREAPGQGTTTGRYSMQLGFQESFDARLEDESWISRKSRPKDCRDGWRAVTFSRGFGGMPYHDMEPRRIPHLTDHLIPYEKQVSVAAGACEAGHDRVRNLADPLRTEMQAASWRKCQGGKIVDGQLKIELPAAGDGQFRAVCVDLGQIAVGTLAVEARGGSGGEVVDFLFTEAVRSDGRPQLREAGSDPSRSSMVNRLRLREGVTRHEFFWPMGHRYLTVVARETRRPIRLGLALRETRYPLRVKGRFECDDPVLNDIHRISVRTQQVCMLDAYVDTPWREQAQWWGDARVQAQSTFHLANDVRLLRRGIRCIARQDVPNGLTYGHAPTIAHGCILPDFSLIWILTIWDDYFQTGSPAMFAEQLPRIERVLDYFAGEGRGRKGLLAYDPRYWLFLDWCDIHKTGTPTLLNLWYLLTLQKLCVLAEAAGLDDKRATFEQLRDSQTARIDRHLWDGRQRMYVDGLADDGSAVTRYSVHTQTLAMLCGLKPRFHAHWISERLLPYLEGRPVASALPSSYWVSYVYDVMEAAGHGADVVAHIRKRWSPMIPFGGCWEIFLDDPFGPNGIGASTTSHAWAAHPIFHLARTLGGVRQAEPAWTRVRFGPVLTVAGLDHSSVVVPTPHGAIRTDWRRLSETDVRVRLKLPRGVRADVHLPGVDEPLSNGGQWEVTA